MQRAGNALFSLVYKLRFGLSAWRKHPRRSCLIRQPRIISKLFPPCLHPSFISLSTHLTGPAYFVCSTLHHHVKRLKLERYPREGPSHCC
ncbi:hypothetical protein BDW02DRAFT_208271 [Decorospora gaudefroyi]|uniref:Uncharacterized protein n=1 Tax=Decorospora gaudefroyi TaxID=184978 RepID=A0A6A5KQV6_9PLEO|nr:hypothetical protein BDW02DRAFT_208271 [Decorospora gaudefroyi]